MDALSRSRTLPGAPAGWAQGEPLWKRVPGRDAEGRPYGDFMLIAPGLGKKPPHELEGVAREVRDVLGRFGSAVVFADFNLKLSILWVSHVCRPGLMAEIVSALRAQAPEFKLVAHHPPPP